MNVNLLISSCGRRVQLIECFRQSATELGYGLRVVGCDHEPEKSAAAQVADGAAAIPKCSSPEFISAMIALCLREQITLIVPTIDPELPLLARHYGEFKRQGIEVAISTPEVVDMANDKLRSYEWMRTFGIATPRTCSVNAARQDVRNLCFPVMLKPISGSGSVGARRLDNAVELYDAAFDQGYLVQEFVDGREYTVNLYFELGTGQLRCAIPHMRLETRGGEVSKGVTVRHHGLGEIARAIGRALTGARGCVCFQAIERGDGQLFVTDINARFGGGYPLAHFAGACFSRWLLEETAGIRCTANDQWNAGITMLRYDSAIFLEG